MMTVELRTIHIGMMAAAESFDLDFGGAADTGVGSGASCWPSRWKGFDSELSCIS